VFFSSGKEEPKSRKEKRKEARSNKNKQRFLSWVQHQVSSPKSSSTSVEKKDQNAFMVALLF
jgi:nucleolar MIF4G domain-containing protein 1